MQVKISWQISEYWQSLIHQKRVWRKEYKHQQILTMVKFLKHLILKIFNGIWSCGNNPYKSIWTMIKSIDSVRLPGFISWLYYSFVI